MPDDRVDRVARAIWWVLAQPAGARWESWDEEASDSQALEHWRKQAGAAIEAMNAA